MTRQVYTHPIVDWTIAALIGIAVTVIVLIGIVVIPMLFK